MITTDGYENASYRYRLKTVKKMIEKCQSKYGWKFVFLGANIDATETAGSYGIDRCYAAEYVCDEAGTERMFHAASSVLGAVRKFGGADESWKKDL